MNTKNWMKNTNAVLAWLEREERGDNGKAIELSIMLGNGAENDDMRSTYWTAIRSIGSVYDDFPVARRGRESSLPDDVEQNALSVKNAVQNAFATIGSADLILQVILPHHVVKGRDQGQVMSSDHRPFRSSNIGCVPRRCQSSERCVGRCTTNREPAADDA